MDFTWLPPATFIAVTSWDNSGFELNTRQVKKLTTVSTNKFSGLLHSFLTPEPQDRGAARASASIKLSVDTSFHWFCQVGGTTPHRGLTISCELSPSVISTSRTLQLIQQPNPFCVVMLRRPRLHLTPQQWQH